MTEKHHEVLKWAPLAFGHQSQHTKAMEELAELQLLLARHNHNPFSPQSHEGVVDEIADCFIMLHQLACIWGLQEVRDRIAFKVERLRKRMGADYAD